MSRTDKTKLMYSIRSDIYEYRHFEKMRMIKYIVFILLVLIIGILIITNIPEYTFHIKLPVFDRYWFIFGMAFLMFIFGLINLFKKD